MYKEDIEMAKKVRINAHSPYSNYQVGAVLRCKNGKIYTGCTIENHAILSICGERGAFVKALSEGEHDFESITIVGGRKDEEPSEPCLPCGYCRQFMSEFVDKDFKIYTAYGNKIEEYTMDDLLPHSFEFKM